MLHSQLPQSLGHLEAGQLVGRRLMRLLKLYTHTPRCHHLYSPKRQYTTGLVHKTTLGRHAAVKRMPTLIGAYCVNALAEVFWRQNNHILQSPFPPRRGLYVVYSTTNPFPSDFSRHKPE